jgi:cytochrome c oxidase subunit III
MIQIPPSEPEKLLRDRPHQPLPLNAGMVPLVLFLASLTMLFVAMMFGYLMIRFKTEAPAFGALHMPPALWGSTFILLASSVTMHMALNNVRKEKQIRFRQLLVISLMLSVGFVFIQFPSLYKLLQVHFQLLSEQARAYYYGLIFFMIVVHALHVLGGIIPLAVITYKAHKGAYDHEAYGPVKYTTVYWHFLDVVWLAMFLTMYFLG